MRAGMIDAVVTTKLLAAACLVRLSGGSKGLPDSASAV